MAKKIYFSRYDDGLDVYEPGPASKFLPEWYKSAASYFNNQKRPRIGQPYVTIKRCVPVFDSMTAGYIITLNKDLYCEQLGDGPYFHWRVEREDDPEIITQHHEYQVQGHPDNNLGYQLKIDNPWIIKTEPGYSCMILPPMHRDNDLIVLPGIVDTDSYYEKINLPFNLKNKSFEGMIPAGTPIAQVIPFKRESYEMEIVPLDQKRSILNQKSVASKLFDAYRNGYWSRKEYK
jgi:hypothetical protein